MINPLYQLQFIRLWLDLLDILRVMLLNPSLSPFCTKMFTHKIHYAEHKDFDMPQDKPASTTKPNTPKKPFNCPAKCDAIQKGFDHRDELDLHMKFFHEAIGSSHSQ